MSRTAIRAIAEELDIPYLLHFTRTENLESILQNGLFPVDRFDEIETTPVINDGLRLDGHLGGISVSIAFPNSKMFYRYRMDDEDVSWVVLVLHPAVLWEKECAFCKHNAADGRISCLPLDSLKTPQAFHELFFEIPLFETREEQCLKKFDPTDVQAEVLVFDIIEPRYIAGVVFDSASQRDNYSTFMGGRKAYFHTKKKGLFASRGYARKYT